MRQYAFFSFDSFSIEKDRVSFVYSFDDALRFTHELTLDLSGIAYQKDIEAAVFALGMAEISSYYKNYCPPKIIIRAGKLNEEQIRFWTTLYTKGLGEFFYKNKIDYHELINIEVVSSAPENSISSSELSHTYLVPIGGGKDSLVTTELLKEEGKEVVWYMLEPYSWLPKLQEVASVGRVIPVGRSVEKNFGSFKHLSDAYNGHVPITAVYIFSAVLAAIVHGFEHVVLSIEASAEEGNITYLGQEINHQYSKTYEFEKATHDYLQRYVHPNIEMYSRLRPLSETKIFEQFVKYEKYFPYFISCNKGLKSGGWCGVCAKCAFVFVGLAAFLPTEKVEKIFGRNLLTDPNLVPVFRDLIGEGEHKPFDCVGTYEENKILFTMAQNKAHE